MIRQVDTSKPIIIDSLESTGDPNTWYSFHWYDPRNFHMQKRPWLPDKKTYHYPDFYEGKYWNRETMRRAWRRPLEFAARHKAPLFVGEFGCVSACPEMEDMVWLLDVISLFDECDISWTLYHYMALAHEPYWRKYFDCGLFTYDVPAEKLYTFNRKVSLLSDLMNLRGGAVLRHPQPIDDTILVYSVALPDGKLRIYVSNKSRGEAKSIKLTLASEWKPNIHTMRMAKTTDGFVDAPPAQITAGRLDLNIMPLNILRLTAEPVRA